MSGTVKEYQKGELKTSRLKLENVEYIMSQLGPYKEMTALECQELTAKNMDDESLSDLIIKMRYEGW